MKKLVLILLLTPVLAFAQNAEVTRLTKYEQLMSISATKVKFYDINLPDIILPNGHANFPFKICIRTVIINNKKGYFLSILHKDEAGKLEAMIEYSDLVKLNKALKDLTEEVSNDTVTECDYIENKYVTIDGFNIGYYLNKGAKGRLTWFIQLRWNSDVYSLNERHLDKFTKTFEDAQRKVESLARIE